MSQKNKKSSSPIIRPKTFSEFQQINKRLNSQGFIAIDFLKNRGVKSISLGDGDKAEKEATDSSAQDLMEHRHECLYPKLKLFYIR